MKVRFLNVLTRCLRQRTITRQPGQAALEYAIALTLLIPILLGIVDLGRAYFEYAELANAANEGARYATIHSDPTTRVDRIKLAAMNRDGSLNLATGDITVLCYQNATTSAKDCASTSTDPSVSVTLGDTIRVTARKTFTPITPLISSLASGGSLALTTTAQRTYQ